MGAKWSRRAGARSVEVQSWTRLWHRSRYLHATDTLVVVEQERCVTVNGASDAFGRRSASTRESCLPELQAASSPDLRACLRRAIESSHVEPAPWDRSRGSRLGMTGHNCSEKEGLILFPPGLLRFASDVAPGVTRGAERESGRTAEGTSNLAVQ